MSDQRRFIDKMYEITDATPGEEVKAAYDAWADGYDQEVAEENAYAMPQRVADTVAAHLGDLTPLSVLDVGCGTGLAGASLARKGVTRLDGCDFSPEMLTKAKTRGCYGRLFEANLNTPPIDVADGAYDLAIAVGVFAHAHLGETAFDEVLRCVRAGGHFCVTTNDHFYETGVLQGCLTKVSESGRASILFEEHGAHLPARDIGGWVFLLRKS